MIHRYAFTNAIAGYPMIVRALISSYYGIGYDGYCLNSIFMFVECMATAGSVEDYILLFLGGKIETS